MTENPNDKIIKQKEKLAETSLSVAEDALEILQQSLDGAALRDVVSVFNSAIKAHRDICLDIMALTDTGESEEEKALGRGYDSKVDALLRRVRGNNQ